VVPNTSSAVRSSRTDVGRQFPLSKSAKTVTPNNSGYRRDQQMQLLAAGPPSGAGSSTPRRSSSDNTRFQNGGGGPEQDAINQVILTGRLGKDATVRRTQNGKVVANFSVGVEESHQDRQGQWLKKTSWHRVQVWEELAEAVGAGLQQGVRVCVEGRLVNRMWVDQDQQKHFFTEIVARDVRLLNAPPSAQSRNGRAMTEEYGGKAQ
jgi:single-strand DNA-binding protein